jgi:hypothetical protein
VIPTLGLVFLAIAMLFVAGYGPTLLLVDRKENRSRAIIVPAFGLACYIVVTHFLASLQLSGGWISLISPLVFGVLVFTVPRNRRLDRREIRESLGVFAICCAGLLLAIWPLLREGYASYLATGNADAAYNLGVYDAFQHHAYRGPLSTSIPYWPNVQFGLVFGVGYLCVLLAQVTGANVLKLHEVVSASLVFVAPATVFLFSVVCLKAPRRTALVAAAASAFSSLVCYTFYLQSIGAMTFIALLPAVLALWSEALDAKASRQIAVAAFLFTGTSFGYYAAFPIMLLLLAVAAAVALARRAIGIKELWRSVAILASVALISFPALTLAIFRRSLAESSSSRLVATLQGPEVLLSFAFALTEQYLTFFWGLLIPPLASGSAFEAPSWGFLFALVLSVLLSAALLYFVLRRRAAVPLQTQAQVSVLLAAVVYFVFRNNGYGAFKLAAYLNPIFLPFLVCGITPEGRSAGKGKGRWLARCRYGILVALVGLNLAWSVRLGLASLPSSTLAGKSMSGFSAEDFDGLSSIPKSIPADARILAAIPDAVVQRWALTYLNQSKVSTVPLLSLSPEEADSSEQLAATGADSAHYLLTWALRNHDVIHQRALSPVWQNAKFQLIPIESVRNFLTIGRGWYRMEALPQSTQEWQHQFRWLRSHGEFILLNASGEELRLRLTVVSGDGQPTPDRLISVALNGEKFDEIVTAGVGNVVTRPFRAHGFMNRLSISLPDSAQPVPSRWGLFRRWVPKDGRRLNVAVSKVELINDREYRAIRAPCRVDLSRPDAWGTPGLSGIYADGWIAHEAHILLEPCGKSDSISIQGSVPRLPQSEPPFPVTVSVNGGLQTVELSKPGPFMVTLPVPQGGAKGRPYDIIVGSPRTFVPAELGLGPDRRRLSIMVNAIEIHQRLASTVASQH